MTRSRLGTIAIVSILLCSLVAGAVPATAAAAGAGTADVGPTDSVVLQQGNETANNSTSTSTPDGPTLATQSRIAPANPNTEYASITARQDGDGFNVTGEFAIFALTEPVEAVRVEQPKASARVLDGSQTVRVSFEPDAAPPDSQSLYTLTLYFEDDSTRKVKLYVTDTDQIVASAELKEMSTFLRTVKQDAQESGYEDSTAGMKKYYQDTKEQAEIFSNLLGPEIQAFFGAVIAALSSSLFVATIAVIVILASYYIVSTHGHKLGRKQNGGNAAEEKRKQYNRFYKEQREAAAEEPLSSIDEVGADDILWKDRFNVATVKQLADLAAKGRPKRDRSGNIVFADPATEDVDPMVDAEGNVVRDADGNELGPPKRHHHGVDDLVDAEKLEDTWLEPMLRNGYLNESQALVHLKYALKRMSAHYGQREYDEALEKTDTLLKQVNNGPDVSYQQPSGGFGQPAAVGGDD